LKLANDGGWRKSMGYVHIAPSAHRIAHDEESPLSWERHAKAAYGRIDITVLQDKKIKTHRGLPVSILAGCRCEEDAARILRASIFCELPARSAWFVIFPPLGPVGFGIVVMQSPDINGVSVDFGGLTLDGVSLEGAVKWVACALTGKYQLRVGYVGNLARTWHLEPTEAGSGKSELASGLGLPFAFFRKRTETLRRNDTLHLSNSSCVESEQLLVPTAVRVAANIKA
jgi:hypothetical protein